MLDKFLNNGFYKLSDSKAFKFFDIDNVKWIDNAKIGVLIIERNDKIEKQLEQTRDYVSDNIILPHLGSHAFSKVEVLNGIDKPTLEWHNDLVEGPNCGCLLYFDDTNEDTGGSIKFRHARSKDEICEIYPKKYDIIVINHSLRFQHMVTEQKMPVPRKVMSLNFYLDERLSK